MLPINKVEAFLNRLSNRSHPRQDSYNIKLDNGTKLAIELVGEWSVYSIVDDERTLEVRFTDILNGKKRDDAGVLS